MKIVILNTAGVPIYEQIKEQIKTAIYSGILAENDMLPSIRQLARELKISVITTTRAYTDLEKEGFIATFPGKGSFVKPVDGELVREQALREIETGFTAAVIAAKNIKMSRKELYDVLDFVLREEAYE